MEENNKTEIFEEYSYILLDDTKYQTHLTPKFQKRKKYIPKNPKLLTAFIPGIIRDIFVSKGQEVKEGDKLLVLEAMKMKNIIYSSVSGKIKEVAVSPNQMVVKDQVLVEFE